ncbi:hypothetical protein D3C84_1203580 [compost metagenome]
MQDGEEQHDRHGALEHQGRSGIDEARVDPAQALEAHAEEQHGKHRGGDGEGLLDNGEHGGPG